MSNLIASLIALIPACSPNVHADTMKALIQTESAFNPYAIAVVDKNYPPFSQPKTLEQAKLFVAQLEGEGKNFSVGLGQINSSNFSRFNVSAVDLLEPCKNLEISQAILIECYNHANQNLNDAFSCYYSGNFKRGYIIDGKSSYVGAIHQNALKHRNGQPLVVPSLFSYSYADKQVFTGVIKGFDIQNQPAQLSNQSTPIKNFSLIK